MLLDEARRALPDITLTRVIFLYDTILLEKEGKARVGNHPCLKCYEGYDTLYLALFELVDEELQKHL